MTLNDDTGRPCVLHQSEISFQRSWPLEKTAGTIYASLPRGCLSNFYRTSTYKHGVYDKNNRVGHLFDTDIMVEAYCVQDTGTDASIWLIRSV